MSIIRVETFQKKKVLITKSSVLLQVTKVIWDIKNIINKKNVGK